MALNFPSEYDMINQSFSVRDLIYGRSYEFVLTEENSWSMKIDEKIREVSQQEVEGSYNYFSSHWQDYDVTLN